MLNKTDSPVSDVPMGWMRTVKNATATKNGDVVTRYFCRATNMVSADFEEVTATNLRSFEVFDEENSFFLTLELVSHCYCLLIS